MVEMITEIVENQQANSFRKPARLTGWQNDDTFSDEEASAGSFRAASKTIQNHQISRSPESIGQQNSVLRQIGQVERDFLDYSHNVRS